MGITPQGLLLRSLDGYFELDSIMPEDSVLTSVSGSSSVNLDYLTTQDSKIYRITWFVRLYSESIHVVSDVVSTYYRDGSGVLTLLNSSDVYSNDGVLVTNSGVSGSNARLQILNQLGSTLNVKYSYTVLVEDA